MKYGILIKLVSMSEQMIAMGEIIKIEVTKERFEELLKVSQKAEAEQHKDVRELLLAYLGDMVFNREGWLVICEDSCCEYDWLDAVNYHLRDKSSLINQEDWDQVLSFILPVDPLEKVAPTKKTAKWELFKNREDTIPYIVDFNAKINMKTGWISTSGAQILETGEPYHAEDYSGFAKAVVTFPDGSTVECEETQNFIRMLGGI